MILYLDTSSLVKLYLEEAHSNLVWEWAEAAEAIATSRVAYAEALSALARRRKEGDLDGPTFDLIHETFQTDWHSFVLLPVKEKKAGALAVKHLLRGFDAIHLAAASDLRAFVGNDSIVFSSFDDKLLQAARSEGVDCLVAKVEDRP